MIHRQSNSRRRVRGQRLIGVTLVGGYKLALLPLLVALGNSSQASCRYVPASGRRYGLRLLFSAMSAHQGLVATFLCRASVNE